MKLSIVVPCFNERESLPQLRAKLEEFQKGVPFSREFVFVDNGSADDTLTLLGQNFGPGFHPAVKILKHDVNRGLGAALRTGFAACGGEYIAAVDSDCTYEPRYLLAMLSRLGETGAAMITASPYHPEGKTEGVPARRLFLSRNLSRLYNFLLGFNIFTYTAMFRVYRAAALRRIDFESNGFLAMTEILIKLVRRGEQVVEFPVVLTVRKYGASSARISRLIGDHLKLILKIIFRRI